MCQRSAPRAEPSTAQRTGETPKTLRESRFPRLSMIVNTPSSLPAEERSNVLAPQGQLTVGFQSAMMPAGFGFQIQACPTYQFSAGLRIMSS